MCPFVNKTDVRCAAHLTLKNLNQAFAHCADLYRACPAYKELITNERNHEQAEPSVRFLAAS